MKATHTPGKWEACFGSEPDERGDMASIYNGEGTIAKIPMDMLDWKANAHLIAAAPDLLAALIGVLQIADRDQVAFVAAHAAIAKATGGA